MGGFIRRKFYYMYIFIDIIFIQTVKRPYLHNNDILLQYDSKCYFICIVSFWAILRLLISKNMFRKTNLLRIIKNKADVYVYETMMVRTVRLVLMQLE